jgi:NitT/TauT family transport system substrate-binding protein
MAICSPKLRGSSAAEPFLPNEDGNAANDRILEAVIVGPSPKNRPLQADRVRSSVTSPLLTTPPLRANTAARRGEAPREDILFAEFDRRVTRRDVLQAGGRFGLAAAVGTGFLLHRPALFVGAASKVTVAYMPDTTCEAATFAAKAQGYFTDEGLDVTLVASPNGAAGDMMAGNVDAMNHMIWAWIPPLLPTGMAVGDLVATAGLQRGSATLVVSSGSRAGGIGDLRGQKVAANPYWRFMFAKRLADAGLDPRQGVAWQAPPATLQAAQSVLTDGSVAAVIIRQPFAAALAASGAGRILVAQNSPPYQHDYCCSAVLSGRLIQMDRPKAAAITRALMRGSDWVRTHPEEAARMEVEANYVAVSSSVNRAALNALDFQPSVDLARRNTLDVLTRFKDLGLLGPSTDLSGLLAKLFVPVTGDLAQPAASATGMPGMNPLEIGGIGLAASALIGGAALWLRRGRDRRPV